MLVLPFCKLGGSQFTSNIWPALFTPLDGLLPVSLKKFAVATALPLFLPSDDETLFLQQLYCTQGKEASGFLSFWITWQLFWRER